MAIASASRPPGASARRAEAKKPWRSGSSWIVCIGTAIRLTGASSAKSAASAAIVAICRSPRTLSQHGEELGVEVERGDRVAGGGERERDAAGAGADVEDPVRGLGRQLVPERQVGRVGAALDVVPDGVLGDGHRQ